MKAARTGKWKVTSLRMRGFFLSGESKREKSPISARINRSHTDTHAWDRSNGRLHFVHDGLNGSFNIFDFGVQFTNQANRVCCNSRDLAGMTEPTEERAAFRMVSAISWP